MPLVIISVRSWPARPTNGSPSRSSSAPGASPTNMSRAVAAPVPKTVCVRVAARCGQRWQTATSAASAASCAGRSAVGTGGLSNPDSPNSEAAGCGFPETGAGTGRGGAAAGRTVSTTGFSTPEAATTRRGTGGSGTWTEAATRGVFTGITGAGIRSRPARRSDSSRCRSSRIILTRSRRDSSDTAALCAWRIVQ